MIEKVFVIILASMSITLGLIMLITPGPGLLFIAIGLGILSTKFPLVKKYTDKIKKNIKNKK